MRELYCETLSQSVVVLPRGFISYLWCSKPVEVVRELYRFRARS